MLVQSIFALCTVLLPAEVLAKSNIIDNTAQAKALFKAAVGLSGSYTLKSATGQVLTFVHGDNGPVFYPTSQSVSSLRQHLSHVQDSAVSQKLTLQTNSDHTVLFMAGENCLSAQWNDRDGYDDYGVAYKCSVGSNSNKGSTVRDAKQWWILEPMKGHKKRHAHGLQRMDFIEERDEERLLQERGEGPLLQERGKKKKKKSKSKKKKSKSKKKSSSTKGTWYRITATDHLQDEKARCLTAKQVNAASHQASAAIKPCSSDKAQLWQLIKA